MFVSFLTAQAKINGGKYYQRLGELCFVIVIVVFEGQEGNRGSEEK
jgi:hypothetical protein